MKKLIVLAVAALIAAPAFADNGKWTGSAGWRYLSGNNNDGLNQTGALGDLSVQDVRAHMFRANIGTTGGWKDVEYGVDIRTNGNAGAANSDWTAAGNNNSGADMNIGLDQGWFRYGMDSAYGDWGFTFGRQMNAFSYEKFTQNLFDNDDRFDGVSMGWKWGSFGLNAAWYVLGARTGTNFAGSNYVSTAATQVGGDANNQKSMVSLTGVQPHFSWKFRDNIETMFAVGYYMWNKTAGIAQFGNQAHGVNTPYGFNAAIGTDDNGVINMDNPRQWQLYNTWSLPYNLSAQWEYVVNKQKPLYATAVGGTQQEVDNTAWTIGLGYGSIKKAHDFKVGYAYGKKDLGAVINRFSSDRWVADNKGHLLSASYALADGFELGWKGYWLKEISKKNAATGVALTTTQENKLNMWEFTAGVNF